MTNDDPFIEINLFERYNMSVYLCVVFTLLPLIIILFCCMYINVKLLHVERAIFFFLVLFTLYCAYLLMEC